MTKMDTKTLFNHLVQDHASEADASQRPRPGLHPLRLRRQPERRLLVGLDRRMDSVDTALVDVFRQLVAGEAPWPLFLHGDVGVGKTLAALCLADFSDTAVYYAVNRLCEFDRSHDYAERNAEWERIAGKALAILDELGQRDSVSEHHYDTVKEFIDQREQQAGSVAIYISNHPPNTLEDLYDERIVSRLTRGTVFELGGRDRRATR